MHEVETAMKDTSTHELYVNRDRTVLARVWDNGTVEVATREDTDAVWDPPI